MNVLLTESGYTLDGKWRLVPVEPTQEMAILSLDGGLDYRLGVKAAPPPPAELAISGDPVELDYVIISRTLTPEAWKRLCNADTWPVTPKSFQRMLDVLADVAAVTQAPPPPQQSPWPVRWVSRDNIKLKPTDANPSPIRIHLLSEMDGDWRIDSLIQTKPEPAP